MQYAPHSFPGLLLTFLTVFDSSDDVVTTLKAGLPLGVEPVFDMGEHDFDSDYDAPVEDPAEGDPAETKLPIDAAAPILPDRTVKAYVVKYTPYKTFVDNLRSLGRPLTDKMQLTRDHLVYLYKRDWFLPQSRVPQRLRQVHLSVCG